MKQILLLLLVLSGGMACQRNGELLPVSLTPESTTNNIGINKPIAQFDSVGQKLLAQGEFVSNVHTTSGGVKLYQKGEKYTLVFDNFKTDSGPDLRIYLSEDRVASRFIESSTKVNIGNYFVEIPANVDLKTYKYVLIWCKSFSVLFGSAELK
ncbi:DM13 domain-containing protein [Runella sp.]|uniref:DM13 domain-containing protein n=1 Tax=Runella sp. TaxID=1960881 RepID=UPI003D105196